MKTIDSSNLIHSLEERVDASIHISVHSFQNLDTSTLLNPSPTGGWSIAQCLEHLNSYGDFYLPHIKKALDKSAPGKSVKNFKSSWLGNTFTQLMLPESGKKYKASKKHIPKQNLDAAAVVAIFIQQQELLLSYLETAKNHDLNTIRIPISIAPFIRLKLGDVFQFLIAHNERHLQQTKRNL